MNRLANEDIRRYAAAHGVRLWHIAKELNISDPTMSRWLRSELPQREKEKYIKLIDKLARAVK